MRNSVWLIFGLFQPICYLFLFAPLLGNLTKVPGFPPGGTYNVFVPGLLLMMGIFGNGFAGFGLIDGLRNGVVERWRVTPANRFALLFSMVLRDLIVLLVQSGLLFGAALFLGFHPDWQGSLLLIPLILLLGIIMSSFSYAVALAVKDESALASSINFLALPLLLLSGIQLPLTLAPAILQNIGKGNPFAYAVDAARALVLNDFGNSAILKAFVIFIVLASLLLYWATSSMRNATA